MGPNTSYTFAIHGVQKEPPTSIFPFQNNQIKKRIIGLFNTKYNENS